MTAPARLLPLAVLGLAAGCGGGDGDRAQRPASTPPRSTSPPPLHAHGARRADPRAVGVIRAWVDAERHSDLAAAARYFALPALVANGGQPLILRTRASVRLWNASLPCGARLLEAVAFRGYTIARFRLTPRPGQRCDGTGNTASTAFKVRRGLIAQWVRVDDRHPYRGAPRGSSPAGSGAGSA